MIHSIGKIIIEKLGFEFHKWRHNKPYKVNIKTQDLVSDIRKKGYAIIPDYYSHEICQQLRIEIETVIAHKKVEGLLWVDALQTDKRCFAAEDYSANISKFYSDPFLLSVADNYFGGKIENSNTLAAKIDYKKNNIGSGQGWHRDANCFQFKAVVFLNKVEIKDGPFQIIKGSHKLFRVVKDTLLMAAKPLDTRFSKEQVDKLIDKYPDDYTVMTAEEGTLVFFDSSCIHSGMPLSEGGCRYSLFNYYYPSYNNIAQIKEYFKNVTQSKAH